MDARHAVHPSITLKGTKMKKALVLVFVLVVGMIAVGCGEKTQTADAAAKKQGAMTPDGQKMDGSGSVAPEK